MAMALAVGCGDSDDDGGGTDGTDSGSGGPGTAPGTSGATTSATTGATSGSSTGGSGGTGAGSSGGSSGTGSSGGSGGASSGGSVPGEPCGEGWGGELIPGDVDLGLASNPEILGIVSGQADERNVFDQINQERMNAGLDPLIWSDQVANVARSHAADMNQLDYFDHGSSTRPYEDQDSWLPFPRLDFVYPGDFDRAGENIASGYGLGEVVPAWMDSDGHRAAILDEYGWSSTHGAVGIDGRMYVFNPAVCAQ